MRDFTTLIIKAMVMPICDITKLIKDTINMCLFFIPGKALFWDMLMVARHGCGLGWNLVYPIYESCINGIDVTFGIATS